MRVLMQVGSRFVRAWYFWAFVLLVIPNCAFNSKGFPCEPGDKRPSCNEAPPCDGVECPPKPCEDGEGPDCEPPCDPEDPDCEPPCDPADPDCEPPCDPADPECLPPDPPMVFDPGDDPLSDAIFCEIPQPEKVDVVTCATQADVDDPTNLSLTAAATALATGQSKNFALDFSDAAKLKCNGLPRKIAFFGAFPDGQTVCLNCNQQIPMTYATHAKACVAKCQDLITFGNGIKPADTVAYCVANARLATNHAKDICYNGACSNGGTPLPNWIDPRRMPEPVEWIDHIGTEANGNSLTRIAPQTGPGTADFNAGAASAQTIAYGDAWIEFEASEDDKHHVLGVRTSCADPSMCVDTVPTLDDAIFAIDLGVSAAVHVFEGGPSLQVYGTFGQYTAGERFRVRIKDNHNGTATISYARLTGPCPPGELCANEQVFYTSVATPAYPLRVDTSFREQGATLFNVNIVRIK